MGENYTIEKTFNKDLINYQIKSESLPVLGDFSICLMIHEINATLSI